MVRSVLMDNLTVLVATYSEIDKLRDCIMSLYLCGNYPLKVWELNNNPDPGYKDQVAQVVAHIGYPRVPVWNLGANLRDTGAFNRAVVDVHTDYVAMASDDLVFIPGSGREFWVRMLEALQHPEVAAVGPSSSSCFASQDFRSWSLPPVFEINQLHGSLVVFKTKIYRESGGYDAALTRGPDVDLSIRLRRMGYRLLVVRDSFIYHYGGSTYQKLIPGYDEEGRLNDADFVKKNGNGSGLPPFQICPWRPEDAVQEREAAAAVLGG